MRGSHLFVLSLAACLLAGCVSQSKYKALEGKASRDIAALRSQTAELEARKAALERQIAALTDQLGATEKRAVETGAQKDAEINRLKGTYESLVKDLQGEISKGQIKVTQIRDKLSVQLVEKILFDSGKAEIKPEGKEVLTKVGNVLLAVKDKQIRIEGYTDSLPIRGALRQQFPTNWELSTQRATTVLRFLQDSGVDGKYLSAVGYGPHRPVASNDTPEGRAANRRIEIALTPLDVQEVLKELR
jgi:chemotaxis protein MotB